jgi:hypothetical protein
MNKKLTQLTEKLTSLNADDLLYVSSSGVSKSIKASTLEAPLKAYADQKKSELITEIEAVESDLADEVTNRIAADALNLTQANSYSDQKKSEVVSLIEAETSARVSGDSSTLTSANSYTDSKHSEAISEVESVEASLDQEISDRIAGDSSTLSSANSYADQKKSEVVSSLNSEISRATAAEAALGVRIDNVLSNIDPAALDSLSEVVAAFQNADSDLNSAISTLASDLTDDLNQEISNRISGQNTLQSAIDSEKTRAQTVESSLQSQITSEQSSRISADNALDARLDILEADPVTKTYVDGEVSSLESSISSVNSALAQEVIDRQADVEAEEVARILADNELNSRITSEVSDLEASISSVSSALAQEVLDRQADVSAEETRAIAAEASLQSQIDGLDTDDVAEGSKLYYTDERVQSKLGNVTGHIIPDTDEAYDLGTPTKKFRELHLSGNTIFLGEFTLSSSAEEGFVVTDPNNESAIVTDGIKEGTANLFFTEQRVQETDLSMLDVSKSGVVSSIDTLVDGISKLQNSISAEIVERASQDSFLESKIDTEILDRGYADTDTLNSSKEYTDQSIETLASNVSIIQTSLQGEVQDLRIYVDEQDTSILNTVASTYLTQEYYQTAQVAFEEQQNLSIQSYLEIEQNARIDGDAATLQSAKDYTDAEISSEQSARASADATILQSAKDYTDNAVSNISSGESSSPTGVILMFAGTVAPTGYLLCDGSAVSRSTYSALFSLIGTSFGVGNNSTTFNLPNPDGNANIRYIIKF